jgi:hypothetical protein
MKVKNTVWLDRNSGPLLPRIALCQSKEALKIALQQCGKDFLSISAPTDCCVFNFIGDDEFPISIVYYAREGCTPTRVAASLVHEAVHIWQHHCKHWGETSPADEQMAYGIEYISENLFNEYVRQIGEM